MSPLLLFLALVAGFVVLVVAGDLVVRGASALARRAGLPPLIVGLTVVAFGTSAPELFVSIQAVLANAPELAIGNIVGSNIANVLLVLGLPALFAPIVGGVTGVTRNAVVGVAAAGLLIGLAYIDGALSRDEGAILLACLAAYLVWQWIRAVRGAKDPQLKEFLHIDEMEGLPGSWPKIWSFVMVGLIGLPIGGAIIVHSGVGLAEVYGVPKEFVGLTAVAIGTSLPELAATLVAALRRHTEVAIGNVLGSNIFNIFGVMGAASVAGTVTVPANFFTYDFWVMLASAIVLVILAGTRSPVGRRMGAGFLLAYITYIAFLARIEGLW